MKSKLELFHSLQKIIKLEYDNRHLIRIINAEFRKKNISVVTTGIFSGNILLEQLTEEQLICLTKALYEYSKLNIKEDINPSDYFSNKILLNYQLYKGQIDKINKIELKIDRVIGEDQWISYLDLEEIYNILSNQLVRYNFETQRAADYVKVGNDYVKKININQKAVDEIADAFYNNQFKPTNLVSFNVPILEGKIPNLSFNEETKELIITPEYNVDSKNTTTVDITDGWHRLCAAYQAVTRAKKEGKKLNGGLLLSVTNLTIEEAANYVEREFRRNDTRKSHLVAMKKTSHLDFARKMNNFANIKENILFNNIADTMIALKAENKTTTYEVIVKALENTKLDFYNNIKVRMNVKKMCNIINDIYLTLIDIDKELFSKSNMFYVYVVIASKLVNEKDYENILMNILNDFIEKKSFLINELKIKDKILIKKINNFIDELFK